MPRVGVVLSGCGVFDGSEIHEAVLTLLALDQRGVETVCFAPDKPLDVVNHRTKKPDGTTRNVLDESARIARGDITNIADATAADVDALVLPGGFGAAKNLCDFGNSGSDCDVDPNVERLLKEVHQAGKPIGLACIAPVVAARILGRSHSPTLTIGHDRQTAEQVELMGARHEARDVDDITVDAENRIVTTPAYMEGKRISEVHAGIDKMVDKVLELVAVSV